MKNRIEINMKWILIIITAITITSCSLQKEVANRVEQNPKENVDLPVDYCNLYPTLTWEQWDNDYNTFNKYLTNDIMRTQMGMSYTNNGVQTWFCMPSARTHVQLDTLTMIYSKKEVIGEWRKISHRVIAYEDSAVYSNNQFYRTSNVIIDDKDDDVYLNISEDKFNMYVKTKGSSTFKKKVSLNYDIESKRYLMLYKTLRINSAISFIGLDKANDRLIVNSHFVQERKVKDKYIVYQSTMTQIVYHRIK